MDASLAFARGALLWSEALVFGTLVVQGLAGRDGHGRLLAVAFAALATLGSVWIVLQSLDMAGVQRIGDVGPAVRLVLESSWVGNVALARIVLWTLAWLLSRRAPILAILPAGAAMALHAALGHAAAAGDPILLAAVLAHGLAAGAWIGGLPALWVELKTGDPQRLLRRFSGMGIACVAVIAITAIVQAWTLAGGLPGLVGTDYGHLLLVKMMLFAGLLALAYRHQFVLFPLGPRGAVALRRSLLVEAGLGAATLAVASILSAMPPGAHEQPLWPFHWRLSLDALHDDDLRHEVLMGLLALTSSACLIAIAVTSWLIAYRFRLVALAGAVGLLWLAVPHLDFPLVPANPTYFWQSPNDSSASFIAAGAAAYAIHCASCHGAGGRGDGRLAAASTVPPADLTAAHLWDHPDGELFGWLTTGMHGPDGSLVMPGFADQMDTDTRWAVIDFLHANNPYAAAQGPGAVHHHQ